MPEMGSPAKKRELHIGRTCFHNLTEYNEIMDSAYKFCATGLDILVI